MGFLSEAEKQALREKIRQAEISTTGEIVTVIANQSDGYRFIPMLWAALISLSIPGLYFLFEHVSTAGWTYPGESSSNLGLLYQIQVLVFLGLGSLFQWAPVRLWLIPKSVKLQRARRHAHEQFVNQGLYLAHNHTGVLIFVSVAEHYVEIIVDKAVADAVDKSVWEQTVNDFIQDVRKGKISQGFSRAIDNCRDVLSENFPASEENPDGNPDELPNHLIEITH